jgi:hypothetical protein
MPPKEAISTKTIDNIGDAERFCSLSNDAAIYLLGRRDAGAPGKPRIKAALV